MSDKVLGTPTMMLLPARTYAFTISDQEYSIKIPRRGKYKDLDPDFFKEEDGEFNLFAELENEDSVEKVLYLPSISKVLFATSKYPDLQNDEAFIPTAFLIKKDEVEILGHVVQMLREENVNV